MTGTNDAVLLVDWLNLSIHVKNRRLWFGHHLVGDLIELAEKECIRHGDFRLAAAHFVGERFSMEVEAAVNAVIVAELHRTRTAKEQADLKLAVLAMDHLHADQGSPGLFLLATGDQDFVPLVERLVKAKAKVVLIVASMDNLAPEYLNIAAQPGVSLVALTDALSLKAIPRTSAENSAPLILGLLKLNITGGVLGGDQARNSQLLAEWDLLPTGNDLDVQMEGALKQFPRTDTRTVAVPAKYSSGNRARHGAKRTVLDFGIDTVHRTVADADWILRRTDASRNDAVPRKSRRGTVRPR